MLVDMDMSGCRCQGLDSHAEGERFSCLGKGHVQYIIKPLLARLRAEGRRV